MMYLVSVTIGDFERWSTKPEFVTEDEEKAKSWVDEFNRIGYRSDDIDYINASYSEIELR